MAGGPAGPEVGRVTVRVAPDTSKFKDDLKRKLTKRDLDEVSNEKKFPVRFEVDNEQLRRQISRIRVPKILVPIDVDRKQVRDAINSRLEKPLRLRAVVIPVRVDHGQVRRALREAIDRVGNDPESLALNLNSDGLRRQVEGVLDQAREVGVRIPAEIDQRTINRSVERMADTVTDGVAGAIESGVDRANVPNLRVPVHVDPQALLDATQEARDLAARILERDQLIVKLDADDAVLRHKLSQIEARLRDLRENPRIVIEADERRLLRQIDTVQRRLDALHSQRVTPQVIVRIQDEQRKLRELEAQLTALDRTVTSRAEAETLLAEQKLAGLNHELTLLETRRTTTVVDVQVDRRRLQEALAAGPRPVVPVDVNIDRNAFRGITAQIVRGLGTATSAVGRFLSLIGRVMPSVVGTAFSIAGRALSGLGQSLNVASGAMGALGKSGKSAGGAIIGALIQALSIVGQLTQALLVAGGISFALAVGGAAITAAWGAVSTAIAAIPAALFLLGAPMAAVALGMDGIKRAAQVLKPEFDRLKEAVSATFERGMRPAFENLLQLFPSLREGMVGIAEAMSGAAVELSKFVTQEPMMGLLRLAFENVKVAIEDLVPGLQDIYSGLLQVAAQRGAFDALTGAVNTFGEAFRESVTRLIGDGTMARAFEGLRLVLEAVARAFVGLVENGIRTFAAAAPGVATFLDDLTTFFGRFDWDRLGAAVGAVFQGLGETLRGIPDGTIERITAAFERLGEVFQDPAFQQQLQNFIDLIPIAIDWISTLIGYFARLGSALSGLANIGVGFAKVMKGALTLDFGLIAEGVLQVNRGLGQMGDAFRTGGDEIAVEAANVGAKAGQGLQDGMGGIDHQGIADGAITPLGPAFDVAFDGIMAKINGWAGIIAETVTNLPEIVSRGLGLTADAAEQGAQGVQERGVPNKSIWDMSWGELLQGTLHMLGMKNSELVTEAARGAQGVTDATGQGLAGAAPAAETALSPLVPTVQQAFAGLEQVNSTIIAGVDNWALSIQLGMQKMATAVQTGMTPVNTAVVTAMTGVNQTIIAAVGTWALSVQLGLQGVGTAVTTGFATSVTPAVTTALTMVNSQFLAGVGNWALTVQLGMQQVATAVTTGFTGVTTAAFTGLATVNQTIIAGVGNWALTMQLGMQQVATAVTTGFVGVQTAVFSGMTLVNQTIIAGASVWAMSIQLGLQSIVTAINTGFATISVSVGAGMAAANQQIIAGASVWAMTVQTQMTSVNNAVVNGFNVMVQTVVQGVTQMNQNLIAGLSSMNASAQLGMQEMVRVVEAGVNDALNVLNQSVDLFRQAGLNMGNAVAQGLMDALPAVQQAANAIVQTAMMAIQAMAMIMSPSRVFMRFGEMMGLGLAIGLEGMEGRVERAAASLVSGAEDYAANAAALFSSVGDAADPFITDWRGQLQGAMDMSAAEPSQPLVGTMVVQTPQGVSAKDVMDQALFRLRHVRRGVYSG